jgi:hypothetical protein
MSHSRRKTPIIGFCGKGGSEKKDKKIVNRRLRSKIKIILKQPLEKIEEAIIPKQDEMMDKWDMSKDGKGYIEKTKDKEYYIKLMRK